VPPPPFEAEGPVDWALGKVFLETILKPIVYLVLPDRIDPRDWMSPQDVELKLAPSPTHSGTEVDDYWFDFVADTGDSDVAAYSIGYLMHGDLAVADAGRVGSDRPEPGPAVEVRTHDGPASPGVLPRGQFLFVGGDTAYPVADLRQIHDRFTLPMNHAFGQRFRVADAPKRRPLLGIPGNHDWYDNLDGFNRTFRRPARPKLAPSEGPSLKVIPRGHRALQDASYFALRLPGNWGLWALDARDGPDMDHRQRAYFTAQVAPEHLLLATPNPAFVDGAQASWVEDLWSRLPPAGRDALGLWFSGDTHHYARYEQVPLPNGRAITSLVSGLGGAALHAPRVGGKRAAQVHPTVQAAEAAVTARLCSPVYMVRRSGLRGLGAVLGLWLGAGAVQTHGEVAPVLDRLYRLPTPPPLHWPLVLLTLAATATWAYRKLTGKKPSETQVREESLRKRLWALAQPVLALASIFTLITLYDSRTFGSVLGDFAFELALLAVPLGVGYLFVSGVPEAQRALWRTLLLMLAAVLLGAALTCGSVAAARAVDGALAQAGATNGFPLVLRTLAAGTAALIGAGLLFPILAGFTLAAAFLLGTQRAFVSSFAALDRFQAFIRFRLRVERVSQRATLTGFVVAVSRGVSREQLRAPHTVDDLVPKAELIDVFSIP